VGPFSSWLNVKTQFGAVGNGVTDDTAAIQNAINAISSSHSVVYLPAGTYKITRTLTIANKMYSGFVGHDPADTTIKWAGPAGGWMMWANGLNSDRWGRITWDGSGISGVIGIAHKWNHVAYPNASSTNHLHEDEVFKNLDKGIVAGDPGTSYGWLDSEGLIRRDKFINIATAAFSTEAWNAYDWYIYDSQFTNCARGLTNEFGAGNFNAYRSVFQNSTVADITINNTYFFGFEDNWSSGSHQFFHSTPMGAGAQILMRGNTILNTTNSVAVELGNTGALTLIDNNFLTKTGASGPVINVSNGQATMLSIGNQYTVANPIAIVSGVRLTTIDDQTVAASTISQTLPTLPPAAPNLNQPVFEIPPGANAATIQSIIDQAAGSVGNRPVVHFPAGSYSIASTLNIPANTDLQLEGDTWATQLTWTGGTNGIRTWNRRTSVTPVG
jgi:polygalacturonase